MKSDKNTKSFLVKKEQEKLRLDQFLSQQELIPSRNYALKLLKSSRVFIKGQAVKASYRLKAGEILNVQLLPKTAPSLKPVPRDLDILFEDEDILLVNKPSGMVTHPSLGHNQDSLVNALLAQNKRLSVGSHPLRPGIVHRLDKDSSGLLIVAKSQKAQEPLIKAFKAHKIKREYWALTLKAPRPLEARLESWLLRDKKHRQKFCSVSKFQKGSKKAISHYKLIKEHPSGLSWLNCRLETGRTHQIRVHLSSIQCPLLGDKLYGQQKLGLIKDPLLKESLKKLNRVALHAFRLEFQQPVSQKKLQFEIPWPNNLQSLLKNLNFI